MSDSEQLLLASCFPCALSGAVKQLEDDPARVVLARLTSEDVREERFSGKTLRVCATCSTVLLSCELAEDGVEGVGVLFHVDVGGSDNAVGFGMVSATPARDEGGDGISTSSTNSLTNKAMSAEKGSSKGIAEMDHRSAIAEHRLCSGADQGLTLLKLWASWGGRQRCEGAIVGSV